MHACNTIFIEAHKCYFRCVVAVIHITVEPFFNDLCHIVSLFLTVLFYLLKLSWTCLILSYLLLAFWEIYFVYDYFNNLLALTKLNYFPLDQLRYTY